jgi:hypothetical protein
MPKIIVTLTSYPARIQYVSPVIDFFLNQTLKPDMIVLYLGYDKFPNREQDLPGDLLEQTKQGLSIHWVKDIGVFTTLVPALIEFPDDIIINVDDDIKYDKKLVENLYASYKKNPQAIHTNTGHRIMFDHTDKIMLYKEWVCFEYYCYYYSTLRMICHLRKIEFTIRKLLRKGEKGNTAFALEKQDEPSFQNFIISTLGTLYPPHSLHKDVLNTDLALKLCPTNDDIWFWTQAVRKGTKINVCNPGWHSFRYIQNSQSVGLFNTNITGDYITPNDIQMQNIQNHYHDLIDIIKSKPLLRPIFFRKIYLFNFMMLLNIFRYSKNIVFVFIFSVIPLLMIRKKNERIKIYLFGFIPILSIHYSQ